MAASERIAEFGRRNGVPELRDAGVDLSGFGDPRQAAEAIAFVEVGALGAPGCIGGSAGPEIRVHFAPDDPRIPHTKLDSIDAKPVIDVQVGCRPAEVTTAVERIEELGFEHLGQSGVPGREYLRRRSGQPANVHVVERGGHLWTDNILFRDHLRTHPDVGRTLRRGRQE
ncbi:GrpB family protein [Kitasatospora sp. NBC_01539]